MKKLLAVSLVILVFLSVFAGCNGNQNNDEQNNTNSNTNTDKNNNTNENQNNNKEDAKDENNNVKEENDPKENVKNDEEESNELEEATLEFVFAGGDPQGKELLEASIDGFNAENPNVTIIAMPSGSGAYADFIKTKDAVGEFPDILECRDVDIWHDKLAELPTDILEMLDNPPAFEGKYYVSPLSLQLTSLGCYYNNSMFEEFGLEEPTTYDEFMTLCEDIKSEGVAPIVIGGKDIWHIGFWWGNYWIKNVFSENPNWIADKYKGEVSFTDDNVKLSFDQFKGLFDNEFVERGWLSTGDNQLVSFLTSGKAAMFFSGSWMIGQVQDADPDFDLGWFPVPDVDGELRLYGGSGLAGFSLSKEAAKDPAKVEAFKAYLKFFYREENYSEYLAKVSMAPSIKNPPEIPYTSSLIQEFSEASSKAAFIDLNWNNKWGENLLPGSFRNYAYKAFQEMVVNDSSAQKLGEMLDKQWEVEATLTE